jgi:hypothetical protein
MTCQLAIGGENRIPADDAAAEAGDVYVRQIIPFATQVAGMMDQQ